MKQIKIVQAYNTTEELSKNENLSVNAKWVLYKLRKDLHSHYDFYISESRNLFNQYETTTDENTITFKSAEEAKEYTSKQAEIDELEVELESQKNSLRLSDVPNITVQQIEILEDFVEFIPE